MQRDKTNKFILDSHNKIKIVAQSYIDDKTGSIYHLSENYGMDIRDILISLEEHKKQFIKDSGQEHLIKIESSTQPTEKVIQQPTLDKQLKIVLRHGRCPGDILPITCLVRDIKKQYGDKILLTVHTPNCQSIWDNNPYITTFDWKEADFNIGCDYGKYGTQKSNSWQYHFSHAFRMHFEEETGLKITPTNCWPEIYLSNDELDKPRAIKDEYWLIWPGNKQDCLMKSWPLNFWELVINDHSDKLFVQIGQSKHGHKPIKADNVINYIDKTENFRDLFLLMYHAIGSIGYISFHLHLAAAFKKYAIVLAGAREPATFIKYNNQHVLSTMGAIPCGQFKGCWGGQIKGKEHYYYKIEDICPNNMCDVPLCMWLIKPEMVSNAIKMYYEGNMYAKVKNYDLWRSEQVEKADKKDGDDKVVDKIMDKVKICTDIIESKKEEVVDKYKFERENIVFDNAPIFKIITNACWFGGGERTATNIIKLMLNAGYNIEIIPSYRGGICDEFKKMLPNTDKIKIGKWEDIKNPCEIFLIHCNDLIWDFSNEKYADFDKIQAVRKIMSINFAIGEIGKAEWTKHMDLYICQSSDLITRMQKVESMKNVPVIRLHPPANLGNFFNHEYNRQYDELRLIRHSGQFNKKYHNNMNEIVDNIFKIRKCRIMLMPAPTFLDDKPRVQKYKYNSESVEEYLNRGNLFWYFVDERKFKEIGANCVLEAMASGLPVLCNNNGGLVDIVNDDTGWVCKDFDEMYDVIKNITMEELQRKGKNAKEFAKKTFDSQLWINYIEGNNEVKINDMKLEIEDKNTKWTNADSIIGATIKFEKDKKDSSQIIIKKEDILNYNTIISRFMHIPKVSFVMPTNERYEMCERAIKNIINQTDDNWELIIVADGVDKKKEELINQYQKNDLRIKYTSNRHRGCWGNYGKFHALQFIRGEFTFFADDNDEIHLDLVKELYDQDYDFIWHRVKFTSQRTLDIQDYDVRVGGICSPSVLVRTTYLLQAREIFKEFFRYKEMDARIWEYIYSELKPRVKRVNKCYYVAYDVKSIDKAEIKGFEL